MKHPVLFCFFLLAATVSFGQDSFQKRINVGAYASSSAITPAYEGGYLMAGYYLPSLSVPSLPIVMSFDHSGNIRWAKEITFPFSSAFINRIIPSSDGAYYAAGIFTLKEAQKSFIVKFDTNGNTIWSSAITTRDPGAEFGFAATSDGGCFIAEQIDFSADAVAIKYGADGKIQWQKTIREIGAEILGACVLTDGSMVVTGYSNHIPETIPLVKILPSGIIAWTEDITSGGDRGLLQANAITATADGGFALCGTSATGIQHDAYAAKFDSVGSIIWTRAIELFGDEGASGIAETPEGNFFLTGDQRVEGMTDSSVHNNGLLISISGEGKILNAQTISIPRTDLVVQALVINSDGSITMAGSAADSSMPSHTGIFVSQYFSERALCHMNNTLYSSQSIGSADMRPQLLAGASLAETAQIIFGEDVATASIDLCSLSEVPSQNETEQDVSLYPDPARETITISGLRPGIYDLSFEDISGRTFDNETVRISSGSHLFTLSNVPSGASLVTIYHHQSHTINARRKFVKE